ncbi:MAG: DNA cytosine methyltransferase [Actinomycetota bacterium]|nr:DNA cytosine methyltransferase [Actinomycetota bacterium]
MTNMTPKNAGKTTSAKPLVAVEICAGAGGQALGLERAGFSHSLLVENDRWACETLRTNRPKWKVAEQDVRFVDGTTLGPVDLLAGGVPCPPFSVAGLQKGAADDRDLFPEMIRLARESGPRAVMIENVRGILDRRFDTYRDEISREFESMGYVVFPFRLLNASDYGVPQLRPRAILVAVKEQWAEGFDWPPARKRKPKTVGQALLPLVAADGWEGAEEWADQADRIGPTLCGGSKLHGGPDLGPTRARKAWAEMGVDGLVLANEPPQPGHQGSIRLTVEMTAVLQGFPRNWKFQGAKTHKYRQVGNAFPPPVARAVGLALKNALGS